METETKEVTSESADEKDVEPTSESSNNLDRSKSAPETLSTPSDNNDDIQMINDEQRNITKAEEIE